MRRATAGLALVLASCAVPYDPEPVRHPVPLRDDAFDLALGVVRDHYRKIVEADRDAFRIQSAWIPMQRGDVPGYRRASLFRGADGQLKVLVEIRFLHLQPDGPEYSAVRGDHEAERELAAALERVLSR